MDQRTDDSNEGQSDAPPRKDRGFLHRVVLVDGLAALFLLTLAGLWFASDALLLIFACMLFAILLHALSSALQRRLHLRSHMAALVIVVTLMAAVLGVGGWLMAPQLSEQASHLAQVVPTSLDQVRAALARYPRLKTLLAELPSNAQISKQLAAMAPNAGLFFSGVLGALGNTLIIMFAGVYFAARPRLYINGIIRLVPIRRRPRARAVLDELGTTLAKWLMGKACSMLAAGIMTAVGLSLLGIPLALILGIIAGLLDFIPYLGPLMAGVPALLIAFSASPEQALYVALLFGGIQLVQGYMMEPMIDQHTVSLPPALTIAMQVLFGAVFGMAGVALATPLTAVLLVLVTMLYVQDILGDDARPPAQQK
ncbi:AI-2E family transporter [Duganella sp. FT92W]|uniref:AI-2E family transporter n=1 Tax=Pseudoduganella rivuli TaxID=2666085 RepID=A0A7X2LU60_9BURK|nr:AI-2E family transporter [Pseudoduganella rivuli]MRV73623.1 AI-2E family transporter [Pseudoduganella rivuli]